jgi:hypothetical protein
MPDQGGQRGCVRVLPDRFPGFGGEDEEVTILTTASQILASRRKLQSVYRIDVPRQRGLEVVG